MRKTCTGVIAGVAGVLLLSALGYVAGSAGLLGAAMMPVEENVANVVLISMLLTGLGWGAVEAASNPMVAALYPEEKTHRLNILHAWWPAGIVVGGLLGVAISSFGWPWELNMLILMLPALVLAWMVASSVFPVTERVATGVTYGQMLGELLKRPLFWVFWACMFLVATSELAPGTWVNISLSNIVGMQGILLLVYVSALMFVMRHFAGALVHRLSPIGVLWFSCLGASLGLVALSFANSPFTGLLAATLWGTGVCYMWPTMLATASERFPKGGALLMGLMGTAGTLSIQFVLPLMGAVYDTRKVEAAGGEAAFNALQGEQLNAVLDVAAQASFRYVAALPAILLIVFGAIWLYDRSKGGYAPTSI